MNIQLIALGGAIGTGLFLGSSTAIKLAGPSILFAYVISGVAIFLFMRAMGEILLSNPEFKSIGDFVQAFLGERWGFLVGWTYWLCWITAALAEFTAIGIYVQYWFPGIPPLVSGLVALGALIVINLSVVKTFGNLESVFSIIKILVILLFVAFGVVLLFQHKTYDTSTHQQVTVSLSNLVDYGGLFPNGLKGFLLSFQMVLFGFAGIEMIGLTAGETKNEGKNLRLAINALPIRILLFYIGAIFVILLLTPWNQMDPNQSPFVSAFNLVGIPAAAGVINFTILVASLSSSNTAVYSTSRILYTSAKNKLLPDFFTHVSKKGIPSYSLAFSCIIFLVGLLANFLVPNAGQLFEIIASITTVCFLFVWCVIIVSHLKYKKTKEAVQSTFKMPFYPISDILLLIFFIGVGVLLFFNATTRISALIAPVWFALLLAAFWLAQKRKKKKNGAIN